MLLNSEYIIIPQLRFTLTFDDGTRKVVTVKTNDIVTCTYKRNGEKLKIEGKVTKISCNFNSSLGAVGTTAYMQIDGSSEYSGEVVYIKPSQVLDLVVNSGGGEVENVVCSVDNDDQKITLIRQNEVGVFQYSLDGVTWKAATGAQGMSAYECAVALGFVGTEEEWLASLKGEKGDPGTLNIYKSYKTLAEMTADTKNVPIGSLVSLLATPSSLLYLRVCKCSCGCEEGTVTTVEIDGNDIPAIGGYDFVGYLSVGEKGEKGDPGEPGKDGKDGADGKSAYQYAKENGYPGTEEEFAKAMAKAGTVATTFYMGPTPVDLDNSVVGPITLKVFGYTDSSTMKSISLSKIDIASPSEVEDQSIIFATPIILRAVPVQSEATKPNIIIDGQKYVADCITEWNNQIGVFRRIEHVDSYNGETIIGDYLSSTGQIDLGAEIQWVTLGKFEPFDELTQSQYRKLHAYDGLMTITTTEAAPITISYPINIQEFIKTTTAEYIEAHVDDIITPVVKAETAKVLDIPEGKKVTEVIDEHIISTVGTLPEGKTVVNYVDESISTTKTTIETEVANKLGAIPEDKTVSQTIDDTVSTATTKVKTEIETEVTTKLGDIPADKTVAQTIEDSATSTKTTIETEVANKLGDIAEDKTVAQTITESSNAVKTTVEAEVKEVSDKIGNIEEGKTVAETIEAVDAKTATTETITTTVSVGGIPAGTVISEGSVATEIIKAIVAPTAPTPDSKVFYGVTDTIPPTSHTGMTSEEVVASIIKASGYTVKYKSDNQYLVFSYEKSIGKVVSILGFGLEYIDGWSSSEFEDGGKIYLNYYSNESLTFDEDFELKFIFE